MLNYLVLSILLSFIGAALYTFWFSRRVNLVQAKFILIIILLSSWLIPFITPNIPHYSEALTGKELFLYKEYDAWNVVEIKDSNLQNCYQESVDSKEMCDCEIVQKANLITFQQDPFYNFLLGIRHPVLLLFTIVAVIFLLEFLIKLSFLIYITLSSYKIKQEIQGTTYYLLYPSTKLILPLSAYTLWYNYIIWSPILDKLDQAEQQAVILHEIAHLKQKDSWQQIFMQFIKLGWWMSPIFYFFRKELNRLNEFVADEFAAKQLGSSKKYALLLLKVKEQQLKCANNPSFALSFAQSLLKSRILYLSKINNRRTAKPWQFLTYLLIILLLFFGTSNISLPFLQKQKLTMKQYEVLKNKQKHTKNNVFCITCLKEEAK